MTQTDAGGGQNDAPLSSAAGRSGGVASSPGPGLSFPSYYRTRPQQEVTEENYEHRFGAQLVWVAFYSAVLILYWDDDEACDEAFRTKWRLWFLVNTIVPAMSLAASTAVVYDLLNFTQFVEVIKWVGVAGFFSFVVGNVFLVQSRSCDNGWDWAVYKVAYVSIVIANGAILLACCIPCVILACVTVGAAAYGGHSQRTEAQGLTAGGGRYQRTEVQGLTAGGGRYRAYYQSNIDHGVSTPAEERSLDINV